MKVVVIAALTAMALAGCSGTPRSAPSAATTPTAGSSGTPVASATPSPTPEHDDFDTAVKYTQYVFDKDYDKAAALAAPGSPAARYVIHQKALREAYDNDNINDEEDDTLDPDKKTKTIKITAVLEGDKASYVWKDFTYEGGKVSGWTGKAGTVGSMLWTKPAQDSALGLKAELVSAYRTNTGSVFVILKLTATRGVELGSASYAPTSGYRRDSFYGSSLYDLAAGDKALVFYAFKNSKFGGKLRLDIDSKKCCSNATLELVIK